MYSIHHAERLARQLIVGDEPASASVEHTP
jgi:hypothetical protein